MKPAAPVTNTRRGGQTTGVEEVIWAIPAGGKAWSYLIGMLGMFGQSIQPIAGVFTGQGAFGQCLYWFVGCT
ncbi:MAG: hypothetical protein EBQ82_06800 [Betaproteobacteria bacterium]|nr:hypothetical protein [Betaproteobacteria bacterium]